MEQFYLQSNGGGRLHCAVWRTTQKPRAVVQLVHGIAEHIARYDHFARFLAENGFVVAAEDHMGHGGSIGENDVKGYFSGGWMTAVADVKRLQEHMKAEYPELPYCILGHSMGSFLLRTYLYTYPGSIDGAIISGTAWQPAAMLKGGLAACKLEALRVGERRTSPVLAKMMFGAYNKPFEPVRTKNDWVCSDPAVVDAYTADPLCGFDATVGLARDLLAGIEMNQKRENLLKMDQQLPVLFVSGGKDPVGGMSKGVLQCIDAFKRAGMRKITIRLYPEGRHEMLNEVNREEVYQDILSWLLSN